MSLKLLSKDSWIAGFFQTISTRYTLNQTIHKEWHIIKPKRLLKEGVL